MITQKKQDQDIDNTDSQRLQVHNLSKAPSALFIGNMIAKLDRRTTCTLQKKTHHSNTQYTNGATTNN